MISTADAIPVSRKIKIIRWTARIAGTMILSVLGLKLLAEAFDNGIITGITFIIPFIIGFILFISWDRSEMVRIPGIIGIAVLELFFLFRLVSGAVRGIEHSEVAPVFSILVMLLGLFLALKWEGLGGALAIMGWVGFVVGYSFRERSDIISLSLVLSPFLVIGWMYLYCWSVLKVQKTKADD